MKPEADQMVVEEEQLMEQSGVNSDNGIGWGGVDTGGEYEANSRHHNLLWDEE